MSCVCIFKIALVKFALNKLTLNKELMYIHFYCKIRVLFFFTGHLRFLQARFYLGMVTICLNVWNLPWVYAGVLWWLSASFLWSNQWLEKLFIGLRSYKPITQFPQLYPCHYKQSLYNKIPYTRHYNLLLIRNHSWILTIHKAKGHST